MQRDATAAASSVARGLSRQAKRSQQELNEERERKRRVVDGKLPDAAPVQGAPIDEDEKRRQRLVALANNTFGELRDVARLDELEFHLTHRFAGSNESVVSMPDGALRVRVKLRGKHVLAGLRQLLCDGCIATPLPSALQKLTKIDDVKIVEEHA